MKKVLSLAIAAAMVAPVVAMADATIYGKIRQSVDLVDDERTGDDEWQINDRVSRIGFKGSEDLGNGLKGVYKLEYGVKISTSTGGSNEFSGDGTLSARNAYVGLAGGFGTVLVGRHDTPLKMSTGKLDYFADTALDNNLTYTEDLHDLRADGTIAYVSPSLAGLTLAVAIVPGEDTEGVAGEDNADGLANAYSLAAMYSNGGIYGSIAYESAEIGTSIHPEADAGPAVGNSEDHEQMRLGLGYDAGAWKVGGVYATVENSLDDSTSWNINGGFKVGMGMIKAKYFDVDADDSIAPLFGGYTHTGYGIGYDHNFSKRTQVSALYVSSERDSDDAETSILSFQVNHNF
ncbi:MAG: porin [Gammaproteobacteria bacterium]|nr:porin [Gammaproteobacteria bacterium]